MLCFLTWKNAINRQHLKANFDLECKISKTTRPMTMAFFHIESVADSQNLQNLAGFGILVGMWLLGTGRIS